MPEIPHNFWQELKRRKVIRVIIGYAAAAYVLLELTSIVAEPLGLPDWTINFVLVLLCIGFIITVVVSWIYDFTPKGIEKTKPAKVAREKEAVSKPAKRKLKVSDIIIAVLLIAVIILAYPKIFKKDNFKDIRDGDGRISVAVMPIKNQTGDSIYNNWQDGFQNLLIGRLSNSDELIVQPFETMLDIIGSTGHTNYASITPSVALDMAVKLESSTLISGSLSKAGGIFRFNVQLKETESSEIYKSFTVDCSKVDDFFNMADSLSELIQDFFKITKLKQETWLDISPILNTSSPDAYINAVQGIKMYFSFNPGAGNEYMLRALEIDPDFLFCYLALMSGYQMAGQQQNALDVYKNIEENWDRLSFSDQLKVNYLKYGYLDKDPNKGLLYLYQLSDIEPQNRIRLNHLGDLNRLAQNYEKEIEAYEEYIELDDRSGVIPGWIYPYLEIGDAYHIIGNHKREEEIYKKALERFSENRGIIERQARCALSRGDTIEANKFIERYLDGLEFSEAQRKNFLGTLYDQSDMLDRAEQFYRDALTLSPELPIVMNNLASLLIENDINTEEGLDLITRALELSPDNANFKHTKGWGLYKIGKYEEALGLLEDSWDRKDYYNHELYLHIQEVKQALAKLKREH